MTYEAQYCDKNARTELKYIKQYNDNLGNEECYYDNMLIELAEFLEHPNFMGLDSEKIYVRLIEKKKFNSNLKKLLLQIAEKAEPHQCEIAYNHLIEILDNVHNLPNATYNDYLSSIIKFMIILKNLAPHLIIEW